MRFHVLGLAHTATNKDYSSCAFTQKVLNFCKMMTERGHTVFHYGNELSKVECTEHIDVTYKHDIAPPEMSGKFDINGTTYIKFNAIANAEIMRRKQSKDFLICMWPAHKVIADQHPDLLIVEAGIGYPSGHFAPFKVFESYAMLHAYRGIDGVATANGNGWWYDVVIPNYFDPSDFIYREQKGDYLLFLGNRLGAGAEGKGINIAIQIAERTQRRLIIAGPGEITYDLPKDIHQVGFVGVEQRAQWMSGARAVLCPSLFVEPFCGVSIEAMFCGTPVISTDWGAFTENNIHGKTGYRCRTMEQFIWAVNNIEKINSADCRAWAMSNFTLDRIVSVYEEYFKSVWNIAFGEGWYALNEGRTDLNWLARTNGQEETSPSTLQEKDGNKAKSQ